MTTAGGRAGERGRTLGIARGRRSAVAEVLLAGAIARPGLAVARSLGRRGIPFVVVGPEPRGMIASSRFVRSYVHAPLPEEDVDAFLAAVLDAVERYDVPLVMPMADGSLAACNLHRDRFPARTTLAAAPRGAVQNVLDKRLNLETARRLGIPCPADFELERVEQLPELIERLGFPMVLKNPGVRAGESRRRLGFKWLIARDPAELARLLETFGDDELPLCQELVSGEVRNLCCFAAGGTILALHEYRSIRRLGWEGNGVLREITAPTPELVTYAERLLAELEWEGVAHLGFAVRADGDVRYMETNGRFWGSVEGSIRMGWDFPYWTYRYFRADDLPIPPPAAIGSRTCWHWGDLRLLSNRLHGTEPTVGPQTGRLRAIADYASAFRPGVHSDVFRLGDPLPALVEHGSGLAGAVRRRLSRA